MTKPFQPSEAIGKTDAAESPRFESKASLERSCTCTHAGRYYAKDSLICINGAQYQCGCGGWFKNGSGC